VVIFVFSKLNNPTKFFGKGLLMFEAFIAAVMAFVNSTYFYPLLTFVLGWLGLGQPTWAAALWAYVMGAKTALSEVIDAIDAILKANGVIPADAPKLTVKEVSSVLNGSVDVDTLAKAQRARLAALRAPN
jgi:hypothetical protein